MAIADAQPCRGKQRGVSGNYHSLMLPVEATKRAWYKWLGDVVD